MKRSKKVALIIAGFLAGSDIIFFKIPYIMNLAIEKGWPITEYSLSITKPIIWVMVIMAFLVYIGRMKANVPFALVMVFIPLVWSVDLIFFLKIDPTTQLLDAIRWITVALLNVYVVDFSRKTGK